MAQIHRISGSTKYLINGTCRVRGKKFETLQEIQQFYDHHEQILAEIKEEISRQQDQLILDLTNEEIRLDRQLQEAIARQTREVDNTIHEFSLKSTLVPGFLIRTGYRLRYWIALALRNSHIHGPCSGISNNLYNVRGRKNNTIHTKQTVIQQECYNIERSYEFLKTNESFLIGAHGEEEVISQLSFLPDEYHVLNDVNLRFDRAVHWRKNNEYIKTCQIDHIVAGPTGIFLLETKNWKSSDIEIKSDKLIHQVQRAGIALWYYTKDYYHGKNEQPKFRSVVISLNGTTAGRKLNQYIDVITPYQACKYIANRETILSEEAVKKIVKILSRSSSHFF
jgi:hypothetical protein